MKQYEVVELSFHGREPEGSFVAVDVKAVFSHEGRETEIKGFYAGDGVYKVRFLPEEAGEYYYRVSGIPEDEGEKRNRKEECAAEGRFIVEACEDAGKVDHGHGIVRADGSHFRYADGNWFYPFGTTVYALAHQTDELIDTTIRSLGESPFNKVRMCLFPKHYHYNHNEPKFYPFEKREDGSWDVDHPCFAFWDAFENVMERLNRMDIQVDLILFHPYDRWGFASMPQRDNLVYLDYLLRRFAAIPNIWWSLANEYDICGAKTMSDWYEIEEFVSANDPFHHLESCHNCFAYWDAARPAITHESLQIKTLNFLAADIRKYGKPVSVDECRYEGDIEESWGNLSGREMTNRFWKAVTQGAYCTHGETFLDRSVNPDDAVLWWSKGGVLKGESPERIRFLKNLAESLPGPIEAVEDRIRSARSLSKEEFQKMIEHLPDEVRRFAENIYNIDPVQWERMDTDEHQYAGHVGDDVYIWYYDTQCLSRANIRLPEEKRYRIEVVDTWNMTRQIVVENVNGPMLVTLPGHEGMAILATRMPEEVRMLG